MSDTPVSATPEWATESYEERRIALGIREADGTHKRPRTSRLRSLPGLIVLFESPIESALRRGFSNEKTGRIVDQTIAPKIVELDVTVDRALAHDSVAPEAFALIRDLVQDPYMLPVRPQVHHKWGVLLHARGETAQAARSWYLGYGESTMLNRWPEHWSAQARDQHAAGVIDCGARLAELALAVDAPELAALIGDDMAALAENAGVNQDVVDAALSRIGGAAALARIEMGEYEGSVFGSGAITPERGKAYMQAWAQLQNVADLPEAVQVALEILGWGETPQTASEVPSLDSRWNLASVAAVRTMYYDSLVTAAELEQYGYREEALGVVANEVLDSVKRVPEMDSLVVAAGRSAEKSQVFALKAMAQSAIRRATPQAAGLAR
jgi:hypothetical protein